MDTETVDYIIRYFSNLMTDDEKLALKNQMYMSKSSDNTTLRNIMIKRKWINNSPQTTTFLKDGYETFKINIVKRIMNEIPEKVFFNNCPKCGKLARTPQAKQCRFCSYNWH